MAPRRAKTASERRVGAYIRISKDRAREISTTVQREQITAYAKTRGWKIVGWYEDKGRSAYKRNVRRPQFDALLDDVDAGLVDTVVVYRLDRLTRSVADFANVWERLEALGAEFVSVGEQFDTTSSMGRAMVSIASVFAELESAVKSERISDALAQRRAAGAAPHGPRPFGLTVDRTKVVPAEARLIRTAARTVRDGGSLRQIVESWNAKGHATTASGGPWNRRGLRHVLTNPHTAGLRQVDGVLVAGTWPAVLDRDNYDAVVAALNEPARRNGGSNGRVHLLSGIATCSLCGTPMSTKPHKAGTRYVCATRAGFDACGRQSVAAANVDELVTEAVLLVIAESPAISDARKSFTVPARARSQDSGSIEDDFASLAQDFGAGRITRREWEAAV